MDVRVQYTQAGADLVDAVVVCVYRGLSYPPIQSQTLTLCPKVHLDPPLKAKKTPSQKSFYTNLKASKDAARNRAPDDQSRVRALRAEREDARGRARAARGPYAEAGVWE